MTTKFKNVAVEDFPVDRVEMWNPGEYEIDIQMTDVGFKWKIKQTKEPKLLGAIVNIKHDS